MIQSEMVEYHLDSSK